MSLAFFSEKAYMRFTTFAPKLRNRLALSNLGFILIREIVIPEDTIRRRYERTRKNLIELYLPLFAGLFTITLIQFCR